MTDSDLLIDEFFRETHACLALLDHEFNFVRVNDAYARAHAHPAPYFCGRNFLDFHPSVDSRQLVGAVRESKVAYRITDQSPHYTDQGESATAYWDCTFEPIMNSNHELQAIAISESEATERIALEHALERSRELLATINRIHENCDRFDEPQKLLEPLLDDVLELSGSEYGFAGEVLRNPDGQPYMRIHAVPWTEETKGFYEAHAPRNMEFTNLDTLFGSVMRTGETVIANDPAHDPRSGGLLEGHPKLENFLGLSLNAGSSLRGIIGVANRPGGYDQALVDYLGPLLRSYEMLIDRIATRQQRRAAEASLQESDQQVRDLAIPAVENEHRELIDLINNCYEEMGSGEDPQTVVRLLDDIHTAISVHFRHEEELMENIGYPEYAAHKMQHERLLDTLRGHIDRFADDPDHALEVVQNILAEWFGQHFSTSDLQLQQHLQE